jgi:maltooligosyltrehalose trehalohydrolase
MVRAGRLEEFAQMEWETSDVPDPQDPRTFEISRLDWAELEQAPHSELLELTKRLISIRRSYPDFTDPRFDVGHAVSSDEAGWLLLERGNMIMVVNFRDRPTELDVGHAVDPVITLGQIEVAGEVIKLGPHSAIAADATEHRIFADAPRAAATLHGD